MTISSCEPNNFQVILNLLEMMRKKLVDDFINEEPNIYLPCFKYAEDPQLMILAIEKYFITWLDSYWILLDEYNLNPENEVDISSSVYLEIFVIVLESWNLSQTSKKSSPLLLEILKIKIDSLSEMLKIGDKSKKSYNKLQLQYEKDKILFEKEIQKLRG